MQKGQCFSAVLWAPPLSEPKMLQINNSMRELLHKKRGCILFLLRDTPIFSYKFYLKQNITVLVQGLC